MSEREEEVFEPARGTWLAAGVVIAATYFYFLIFAEFAFIELARPRAGDAFGIRQLMAVLGVGGVAGSLLAAWRFQIERYPRMLSTAFRAAGAAAVAALVGATAGWWMLLIAAGAVGLSLGWLTVTLSAGLRATVGRKKLGVVIGAGTGAAYALANVPWIFQASPRAQTIVAAVVMGVGAVVSAWLRAEEPAVETTPDHRPAGVARWIVILMALVWMDSAAFYVIQHTPALREHTWGGVAELLGNSGVHLVAAIAAGWLLDRGPLARVAVAAFALLAAACWALDGRGSLGLPPQAWYVAGVSLYSTLLVYFAARGGRAWQPGVIYAVAGWVGSAMGIGMATDLNRVPPGFVLAAGLAIAAALVFRGRGKNAAAAGALVMGGFLVAPEAARAETEPEVLRGREVYVAEGCIHCHSQYVRPGTADVTLWGPTRPLADYLTEQPPLLGNRRQGPDLTHVGNRRSPEWNRLHLIEPRAITPGSRMPSYAHLFRDGDTRGEALVSYLASLGAETAAERGALVTAWKPAATAVTKAGAADARAGEKLFATLCSACHGNAGTGDGALAARLAVKPPDWRRESWRRIVPGDDVDLALARTVKFGLPGSAMAGHEYLRDEQVVALVARVRALQAAARVSP